MSGSERERERRAESDGTNLKPHHDVVGELESVEAALQRPSALHLFERREDDRIGRTAVVVDQDDRLVALAALGDQVVREDAEHRLVVRLDPQVQLVAQSRPGDVLAVAVAYSKSDVRRPCRGVHDGTLGNSWAPRRAISKSREKGKFSDKKLKVSN